MEEDILVLLSQRGAMSSSEVHAAVDPDRHVRTTKRVLDRLVAKRLVERSGERRATRYRLSDSYALLHSVDVDAYFAREPDERAIQASFNFELLREQLPTLRLFTDAEREQLTALQVTYRSNVAQQDPITYQKEVERLAIDLSWKSSQIEGNTYSLLETERLLKEKQTAAGKTKDEAVMLLNHKEAIDFVLEHPDYLDRLTVRKIEDIHSLLTKELGIARNLRNRRVGITGTNYRPLDNEFQIKEAFAAMCKLVNGRPDPFDKALLALVLISYIQGFVDGNKRTARIVSNALLIAAEHCPLSFRTVDSVEYKKAMLVFYERNNITPFKRIFMEQFAFAVDTYF